MVVRRLSCSRTALLLAASQPLGIDGRMPPGVTREIVYSKPNEAAQRIVLCGLVRKVKLYIFGRRNSKLNPTSYVAQYLHIYYPLTRTKVGEI